MLLTVVLVVLGFISFAFSGFNSVVLGTLLSNHLIGVLNYSNVTKLVSLGLVSLILWPIYLPILLFLMVKDRLQELWEAWPDRSALSRGFTDIEAPRIPNDATC